MININKKLAACLDVVKKYEWLLDAYVLVGRFSQFNQNRDNLNLAILQDFYVDDHWSKLPQSWRQQLEDLPLKQLSELLHHNDGVARVLWPLELLALRQVLRSLCIGRSPTKQIDVGELVRHDSTYSQLSTL